MPVASAQRGPRVRFQPSGFLYGHGRDARVRTAWLASRAAT